MPPIVGIGKECSLRIPGISRMPLFLNQVMKGGIMIAVITKAVRNPNRPNLYSTIERSICNRWRRLFMKVVVFQSFGQNKNILDSPKSQAVFYCGNLNIFLNRTLLIFPLRPSISADKTVIFTNRIY